MNRPAPCLLALLCLWSASSARAEGGPRAEPIAPDAGSSAPTGPSVEQRYGEAQAHFIAARYTEALPIFQQLYAESGSPNATLYVARCLREMGQLPEAYEQMVRTERVASERAASEERFAPTRESARKELAELEQRVGRLTLTLPARPDGLEIEVNGRPVASDRWGAPLAVMPGAVRIWATAPGHATLRQEIDIAAGSSVAIALRLSPESSSPVAVSTAAPHAATTAVPADGTPPHDSSGASGLLAAGIVMVGVGVLGMGTFAVSGILANQQFADVKEACGGERCADPSHDDEIETGRTLDTVANVGLVVGLAGLATAGVLIAVDLATGEPTSETSVSRPRGTLALRGEAGGATLTYRRPF